MNKLSRRETLKLSLSTVLFPGILSLFPQKPSSKTKEVITNENWEEKLNILSSASNIYIYLENGRVIKEEWNLRKQQFKIGSIGKYRVTQLFEDSYKKALTWNSVDGIRFYESPSLFLPHNVTKIEII